MEIESLKNSEHVFSPLQHDFGVDAVERFASEAVFVDVPAHSTSADASLYSQL